MYINKQTKAKAGFNPKSIKNIINNINTKLLRVFFFITDVED